jgi:hypothetical protein
MARPPRPREDGGDAACWAHLFDEGSVDPEAARRLAEQGWLAVAGVLTPSAAERLAAACERVLAADAAAHRLRPGDKPAAGTHHLSELADRVPSTLDVLADERLLSVVRALVGPDAQAGGVHYRCPQPGHGGQRLHADSPPLLEVGPAQVATCIVALTDFTDADGATRLVPGSHLRPDQQRLSGNLESHPDERLLTGAAGTAFVFSGHVLHSGTTNRSSRPRPSLQVTWGRSAPGPTR